MWERLLRDWLAVQKELEDLKETPDWAAECQKVLKLLAGWSIEEFLAFILFMADQQFATLDTLGFAACTNEEGTKKEKREGDEDKDSAVLLQIFNLVKLSEVLRAVLEQTTPDHAYILPAEQAERARKTLERGEAYIATARAMYCDMMGCVFCK